MKRNERITLLQDELNAERRLIERQLESRDQNTYNSTNRIETLHKLLIEEITQDKLSSLIGASG